MQSILKKAALTALLALPALAQARLSLPLVDPSTHATGTAVSLPIWSSTDVMLNVSTLVTVRFPSDWTVPAMTAAGFTACGCVFTKYGMTYSTATSVTGTFTVSEVTVTAGYTSGQYLYLSLPAAFAPGPFYLRIDDYAAFVNPTSTGLTTLTVSYLDMTANASSSTESKAFSIGTYPGSSPGTNLNSPGQINGYIYDSYLGTAAVGIPVVVQTDDPSVSGGFVNSLP
jgi:hypothetical protein